MKLLVQGTDDRNQYFQLRFAIPLAIVRRVDSIVYLLRKALYLVNPDHCVACGRRMFVREYQFKHTFDDGRSITVQFDLLDRTVADTICRHCIADRVEHCDVDRHVTTYHQVFVQGRPTIVYQVSIDGELVLNVISDGRDHVCKQDMLECVNKGRITTMNYGVWNRSKTAALNEKRLFINDQGELM
jgi:hypothetical protein